MSTKKSEERCDIVRLEAMSRLDNLFLAGPGSNWYKAKGFANPQAGLDKVFIALILLLYLGHAGRVLGVDGWRLRCAAGG